jgi:peroxiredoxin Q/BCP
MMSPDEAGKRQSHLGHLFQANCSITPVESKKEQILQSFGMISCIAPPLAFGVKSVPRGGDGNGMALVAGDKAPTFKIKTDEGGTISSGALKGSPYVLYFYPKDDTSGCTKEAIGFSESLRAFAKLGIAVIGVSRDSLESHAKFRKKHKLKVALGSDPETQMAEAWGVWGEKTLYGRKYMGMERATFLVDGKGVIAQAWRKVKVPGHVDAVLEAAKAL